MVLTYSMVLGRLDTLNQREAQVRKFYKPLAMNKEDNKPYPRRHRYADVLEPGDVVRTIDKGDDDGWEEARDIEGKEAEGEVVAPSNTAALKALRDNRQRGPSRESQRVVSAATKKESQLRKAIDGELNQRKETLKHRLYREAGIAEDGDEKPREDDQDKVNPLFGQVKNGQMMFPKPALHKTGTATPLEIKVVESTQRFSGGSAYGPQTGATRLGQEMEQAAAAPLAQETLEIAAIERQASATSMASIRSGSVGHGVGINSTHESDHDRDVTQTSLGPLSVDEEAADADAGDGLFLGPVSTWGYRRSIYSEHDDPRRREFYFTQHTLPLEELNLDSAQHTYLVHISQNQEGAALEHVCEAAGRNEQGMLLFSRSDAPADMLSTILSTADVLPWVRDPEALIGQDLEVRVYRRNNKAHHAGDEAEDELVSERLVTFRKLQSDQTSSYPVLPPLSAPGSFVPQPGHSMSGADITPPRPDTAPASPPAKHATTGPASAAATVSTVGASPQGLDHPAKRWNEFAEGAGAGAAAAVAREVSRDRSLDKSYEESPAARKKKELSRMRQQMRASLQQTQSQVLASMGGPGQPGARLVGVAAGPSPDGDRLVVPMKITSRPPSSAGGSPGRPITNSSNHSVRFR